MIMAYMSTQSMSIAQHVNIIDYRRPVDTDVGMLQAFFHKNMIDNFSYFPKEAHANYSKPWETESLTRRINEQKDLLLCAFDKEKIVGMVSGTAPEGGVATIIWLTVDPAWQNQKIGARLLERAKTHYRSIGAHKLKLTVHDKKAVAFYQREGMLIEALHPRHWWQLDFWQMVCFLDDSSP
jgi:GNAT superfamily N-acetyltransferase